MSESRRRKVMGEFVDYLSENTRNWTLFSAKDNRWCCSGEGGQEGMWRKLARLKEECGERPDDLKVFGDEAE
jgi:hypothetical protein